MDTGRSRIGVPSAAALVVANMIGVGVFTTSGFALASLQSPELVLLAWAVGGVLALTGALSYAALVRCMPESGGEYLYLSRGIHPLAGFMAGWVSLLAGFTAPIAAAAAALDVYCAPLFGISLGAEWLGTIAIIAAGLIHSLRLRSGSALQTSLVVTKLVVIVAFVAFALTVLPDRVGARAAPSFDAPAFAETLVWISLSYSGWNAAVYMASEIRDPERNVGRALLWATVLVTVFYLALNAVFVFAAPLEVLAGVQDIGARAAFELGGEWLRDAVRALVGLALFTSISAMVMAGPRVYARMAEDRLFPRVFDAGGEIPAAAIWLQVGLAVIVLWVASLRDLLGYIGFTLSLSSAAAVVALMRLRRRDGPGRVPVAGYPWVPLTFVLSAVAIGGFFAVQNPSMFGAGIGTVLLGVPMYFAMRRTTT